MSPVIIAKLTELEGELKKEGLWQNGAPGWVNRLDEKVPVSEEGFAQWLQFVFLPTHLQPGKKSKQFTEIKAEVLQAIKFFGNNAQKGKLLQILIELDSLI